ncbi:MAG: PIG-L deacetylase family protein [Candidatus Omnitrophota bacterium]|nr:PIG-L deacetylase family protein [Candidatus Omnitrophota bacterium]
MNILAIGAHPDDIEFGCGGALIKYSGAGHKIYLLILSKGEAGGNSATRRKEQEKAAKLLKAKKIYWGDFPDAMIPEGQPLISFIEDILDKINPDIVFTCYPDDVHQDHRNVGKATLSAARFMKNILYYELPTSQGFEPDLFIDIRDSLKMKLDLLKSHRSQINKTPNHNSNILETVKSWANFRGTQATVKYAEGFKSHRLLLKI